MKRGNEPGQSASGKRWSSLRPKRWGVKKKPKKASWRDAFLPDWMLAGEAPKLTPYEEALFAVIRQMPCFVCGCESTKDKPNQVSHVALSANQKGTGLKVPHSQVVSKCGTCHREWEERRGFCAGWSRDKRYAKAAEWLKRRDEFITPGVDNRTQADELERLGLGRVIGNGRDGWAWMGGSFTEMSL